MPVFFSFAQVREDLAKTHCRSRARASLADVHGATSRWLPVSNTLRAAWIASPAYLDGEPLTDEQMEFLRQESSGSEDLGFAGAGGVRACALRRSAAANRSSDSIYAARSVGPPRLANHRDRLARASGRAHAAALGTSHHAHRNSRDRRADAGFAQLLARNRNYRFAWMGQIVSEWATISTTSRSSVWRSRRRTAGRSSPALMLSRAIPAVLVGPVRRRSARPLRP